jgi:D-xylose 1-dehydrogenase (NADP+, D-xylono-1,5-lactone-forming)
MTETSPVGFGVIGARSMVATKAVMPAIDASDRAQLVATASLGGPVPEPWGHLGAGLYDDVIDHPDVEVVYVPLPNGMHVEWVERAIAAGKHVLCEKPITSTAADARRLIDAAERAGVLVAEAWMTPFDARWRRAISMAAGGELGQLIDIDASFTFTIGPENDDNYRWSADQGGGALLDVGIYCLGPIVELWGSTPDLVEATALWHTTGVDARTEATLEWVDGRQARIRCSFVDDEEQRLEIIGSEASLVLASDAHTGGRRADTIVVARNDGRVRSVAVAPSDPYLGMVDAFADAVRGEVPWPRPASAVVELVTLIERIEQASR